MSTKRTYREIKKKSGWAKQGAKRKYGGMAHPGPPLESPLFMLGKRFQQQSNMKFAQLHYFYHKMLGGQKILCLPVSKSWGGHVPAVPS